MLLIIPETQTEGEQLNYLLCKTAHQINSLACTAIDLDATIIIGDSRRVNFNL